MRVIGLVVLGSALLVPAPALAEPAVPAPRTRAVPEASAVTLTASSVFVRTDAKLTELDGATLAVKREVTLPPGSRVVSDRGSVLLVLRGTQLLRCSLDAGACVSLPPPPARVDAEGVAISASGRTVVLGEIGLTPMDFRLHVLDVGNLGKASWRSVVGRGHPVAGGVFQLCDLDDARASWCWTRGPDPEVQDLATGKVLEPPAPARRTSWSARQGVYPQDESGIELSGPGPSRWVEVAAGVNANAARAVVTCGVANHALVVRDAALELRALPAWKRLASWSGEVVAARCAPDGKRLAWLVKGPSGVELRVVDR